MQKLQKKVLNVILIQNVAPIFPLSYTYAVIVSPANRISNVIVFVF